MRRQRNRGHILEKKSANRKRRLKNEVEVTNGSLNAVKRQLGM